MEKNESGLSQQAAEGKSPKCAAELFDEAAGVEIQKMLAANPDSRVPIRKFLDDECTEWRHGKPKYNRVNLEFLKGKTKCHLEGTLEMIVENAVKTWEMEASHKVNTDQWKSIVHEEYSVHGNYGHKFNLEEASERGNYNVLLDNVADKKLYDASKENFESSHKIFEDAFPSCFPWEVLEVLVGPPTIVFSWRHWGEFSGHHEANVGKGELLEMTGFAVVNVTEDLKIKTIEVFYNPIPFLKALKGIEKSDEDFPDRTFTSDLVASCEIEIKTMNKREWKTLHPECYFEANCTPVEALPLSWIITEVFTGKPKISFAWKHSKLSSHQGLAIVELNEDNAVKSFKVFFKRLN